MDTNSVFVSRNHARRFGGECFVYNGLDWDDYGPVDLRRNRSYYHFLGKAAWRVKNVRGAISVAKSLPGGRLEVLGGYRFNFKMGLRLTFSPKIKFEGMVGGNTKNQLLGGSCGLIFPVIWDEPFGLAITESLYFGAPVFATPYGSLPELVEPEVGFLTDSKAEMVEHIASITISRKHAMTMPWSDSIRVLWQNSMSSCMSAYLTVKRSIRVGLFRTQTLLSVHGTTNIDVFQVKLLGWGICSCSIINKIKKKMKTSNKVHSFLLSEQEGNILLTAQDYPWSVFQVIPATPDNFNQVVAKLKKRGMVGIHDTDRTFCIIHLASGDHDGKHPERFIHITQSNYKQFIEDLKDAMAQAAVWYKTNILSNL